MNKILKWVGIILGTIFLLAGLFVAWFIYSNRVEGVFKKYIPQVNVFQPIQVVKRPNTDNRAVITDKGQVAVFLNGGYKGLYVNNGKLPFVNFHVESAPTASYEADRLNIEAQYKFIRTQEKDTTFSQNSYKNHQYLIVGNSANESSGVREDVTVFFPEDSILVTFYFLNQGPDKSKRDYETTSDYIKLRDQFIHSYVDSVLNSKAN